MGIYCEQGAALGKPQSDIMANKHKQKLTDAQNSKGHLGMMGPKSAHSHISNLQSKEKLTDVVFVVGGYSPKEHSCPVERFCPLSNEWRVMAPVTVRRGDVGVCALGGMIYAVGGRDDITCVNRVDKYDPDKDEWSGEVASLSSPRSGVCVLEMDGYIYALGGFDGTSCTNAVERYDPELDSWCKLCPMRQHRSGAAAAVLDGCIYVLGGTDGETPLNSVERLNLLEGVWEPCPPMKTQRESPGCVVYLGCLYVAGGRDELLLELSTVEKFDHNTFRWSPVRPMRHKRHQVSLMTFGERLLAVGGFDGISSLRTIETYSPETNTWRHLGSMKTSHPGGRATLVKTHQNVYNTNGSFGINQRNIF